MQKSKIVLFGDSIGKGVLFENGVYSVLKNNAVDLLNEQCGLGIDNRSRFGQTVSRICEKHILGKYVQSVSPFEKNIAVIELGGNDSAYDWKAVACAPNKEHDSITPLPLFSKLYEDMLNVLLKKGIFVFCCNLIPMDPKKYLKSAIPKEIDKGAVLDFLKGDLTTIYRHHELFNDEIIRLSHKNNVPIIDIRKPFLKSMCFSDMICDDGIHLTSQGQFLIYQTILNDLDTYKDYLKIK